MVLLGTSLGGCVALDFALAHPEAVEKLVLIDSQVNPALQAAGRLPHRAGSLPRGSFGCLADMAPAGSWPRVIGRLS
jgi:pimeloyl-ACP methyl ester carboxylesterase